MDTILQIADKVALVTGAGSGIGRATAELLAQQGAKVGLLGRTAEELSEVEQRITAAGGEALKLVADISQAEEMETAVRQLVERWGRLDIVFPTPVSTASGPRSKS
jgi:NADP-dependent 3-hydroxy acid dehydrogenase YdfG